MKVNDQIQSEMQTQIDLSFFGNVLAYFYNPTSEINGVGVVQEGFDLAEIAAKLVEIEAGDDLYDLLDAGALRFAVPVIPEKVLKPEYCILFAEIDPRSYCDVIYLPPLYLCKIRPGYWPN